VSANDVVPAVWTTAAAGTWLPTPLQEVLIDAALGDGAQALAAFSEWAAQTGLDGIDRGSFRLLPLVAHRVEPLETTSQWSAHLRGILRRSWLENQLVLQATVPALDVLRDAGIDVIVLKGGALAALAYPSIATRPMDDLDLLVPEARAAAALAALRDADWTLPTEQVPASVLRGQVPGSFRRIIHSVPLQGRAGFDVDLHWHATEAWCWPDADRGLWAATRPLELRGRRVHALGAADELIVACVHGLRPNPMPPIRWIVDTMILLRSGPIPWELLVARARELYVEPHLVLAFDYLRTRFAAEIPDWVVDALRERRPGYFERQWFDAHVNGRDGRGLAAHYGYYLRGARRESGFQRYVGGLPEHLVYLLGCDSQAALPAELGRRAARRLRRRRSGTGASPSRGTHNQGDRFHGLSVSVIVPVHEHADYLAEALQSIAMQTFPPDEILVVVDGPPVDLTAALDACGPEVRVLHRPRGGPGAARNTGCRAAKGTVLAFLDSDDLWLPSKLELQLTALAEVPEVDIVFTGVEQFFSPELGRTGRPQRHDRAERAGICSSAMLIRAAPFHRVGGFHEGGTFGELVDFYARAVDADLRVTTLEQILVRRRVHDRNIGVTLRSTRDEYATVIKSLLDRRRAGGSTASHS
jgi:hypothetical protein